MLGEVLRFFDQHLAGRETGLADEDPIHYFAVHAEEWRVGQKLAAGDGQPPLLHRARPAARGGAAQRRHGGRGQSRLHRRQRHADALRAHRRHRRHPLLQRLDRARSASSRASPPRRSRRRWRSPAIPSCRCGSPRASRMPRSSSISPRSRPTARSRYVTEGVLRAIHRAEAPAPRNYRTTWPWRTFARKDARPMPIGEPQLLRFALLPIAWRFAKGSRSGCRSAAPMPIISCRRRMAGRRR